MSSDSGGLCWCASEIKCPHGISAKIPLHWDALEKIIDDELQLFDRKSLRKFLKKQAIIKDSDEPKQAIKDAFSPEKTLPKTITGKATTNTEVAVLSPDKRAKTTQPGKKFQTLPAPLSGPDQEAPLSRAMTAAVLPSGGFSRDLMSNTLPKLPPRVLPPSAAPAASPAPPIVTTSNRPQAWGNTSGKEESRLAVSEPQTGSSQPIEMPGETNITVGLMRIVDAMATKILPWQAVMCPKAIETLRDVRQGIIHSKHVTFIQQMKSKLNEKVMGFVAKKEEEVDIWMDREIKSWNMVLSKNEVDLTDFVKEDLTRITERAESQEGAYKKREMEMATLMDDHERDSTREQLNSFRRIVRKADKKSASAEELQIRALQDSIAKAQSIANKVATKNNRDIVRRIEESHDWLCSLADNAVTAAESETLLQHLYSTLDSEKLGAIESVNQAVANYREQHASIVEAIVVFAGRIHQHASDYLQREQLMAKAFAQYLSNIVNGEIKSNTLDTKKTSFAWELKSVGDRSVKREQLLLQNFHNNMNPLDKLVNEFKEKMRLQLDHVTMKLQSVLNGRENDINARKAAIHKKLAKHVNKACNARRKRLKDATIVRRDEFDLEEKCISSVEAITSDLRSAVDQAWVREHLKERRIYEAASGRMERLEKSALIIWNKHSHLAMGQKEEYEEWLYMYRKDRDVKMNERRVKMEADWTLWRNKFGGSARDLARSIKMKAKKVVCAAFPYDMSATVDENVQTMSVQMDAFIEEISVAVSGLRHGLAQYLASEVKKTDAFAVARKAALVQEWNSNLKILNGGINRRIGGLKDMEADLEETVRLTILQHEVENGIFEQLSCSRLEQFWVEWRNKIFDMAKELRETQEDYHISKNAGKTASKGNKKDRALDDLVFVAQQHQIGVLPSQVHSSIQPKPPAQVHINTEDPSGSGKVELDLSDSQRMKKVLDEVRPEAYREFSHTITRGLEKLRKDLGEGRIRLVPAYAVARVLLAATDTFWDRSNLAERCVGRISAKGVLLFREGLPVNARSLFCLGSVLTVLANLQLREGQGMLDCDEVFENLNNPKQLFLVGILTISIPLGGYGSYVLRSECMWACSLFGVEAPAEILMQTDAGGMDRRDDLTQLPPSGFYSEDPTDLLNSVLTLPIDLPGVQEYKNNVISGSVVGAPESDEAVPRPSHTFQYKGEQHTNRLITSISNRVPMDEQLKKLSRLVPHVDAVVFACILGRPDKTMEVTTHRLCEVVYAWRRASLAISMSLFSAPSSEFNRIKETLTRHHATYTDRTRYRASEVNAATAKEEKTDKDGQGNKAAAVNTAGRNIRCMSPFESISNVIDWMTSVKGLPISVLQALSLVGRGGSCDPWLEDFRQSLRYLRFEYDVNELLDVYCCDIPLSISKEEEIKVFLPKDILERLQQLDLNNTGMVPVEALRTFLGKGENNVVNSQISAFFWCICRAEEDEPLDEQSGSLLIADGSAISEGPGPGMTAGSALDGEGSVSGESMQSFQTGGAVRPEVKTVFRGDPVEYMKRFEKDVAAYLESMPAIDTNVVLGYLPLPLTPSSAYELVGDAMKLDSSARNPIPNTCCIWMGQRMCRMSRIMSAIVSADHFAVGAGMRMGVGQHSFHGMEQVRAHKDVGPREMDAKNIEWLANLRIYVEIDIISKYPEMCEVRATDKHYGPAGNEPIVKSGGQDGADDHWKELTERRISRADKLTLSWRDAMLNEWSASLFESRQQRYRKRVTVVKQCIDVYHRQYKALRESIVSERFGLISRYAAIESELLSIIQEDYNFYEYHTSYLERCIKRFEANFDRAATVLRNALAQYIRHCGTIRRRGLMRVANAGNKLQEELETSCQGMIMGYTSGSAQGYFDELIYRGEQWRNTLTELQGQLMLEKEKFVAAKDEVDRDLTIQVSDRLTVDRNRTKGHLEALADDTAKMLDVVANTRASYAALQKDGNARLILRIEKAIRESRKLRVAAEQQAELERAVMRDIRQVLEAAKFQCATIVQQLKDNCMQQLDSIEPMRTPHREKMMGRVGVVESGWSDVDRTLMPLVDDYQQEMLKQLAVTRSKCIEMINVYRDLETKSLQDKHKDERRGLIADFREHFREYDLQEEQIFARFNADVQDTVREKNKLYGPTKPKFIVHCLGELEELAQESIAATGGDVVSSLYAFPRIGDDHTLARMEIGEDFRHSLQKMHRVSHHLPVCFIREKKMQLKEVEEMSLAKNGDMVRPQVRAVMDLLLAGIEIDTDFRKGYENLWGSTALKSDECVGQLEVFVDRYSSSSQPLSIGYSAELTRARIARRRDEVHSLLDASNAHIYADHTRLDVLLSAARKDVEEWASLTLQLIENAFNNAENTYLSNLWPTPPASPRLDTLPPDEDRVGKLKELLNLNIGQTAGLSSAIGRPGKSHVPHGAGELVPADSDGADSDGDSDDERERERKKARKVRRKEREQRKQSQEEDQIRSRPPVSKALVGKVMSTLRPNETRELQQGWFECCSEEGYKYFFNPNTGESLWELPERLKVALHDEDEESLRLIDETPREMLDDDLHAEAAASPDRHAQEPIRVVSAEFMLNVEVDPKVIVTGIAEEARALAQLAMETALDVSAVIHKHRGNLTSDSNIAKILGDKVHSRPHAKAGSQSSGGDSTMRLGGKKRTADMQLLLDQQPQEFGEDFHRELESLMAASTVHEIVDERRWLQLGLGGGDEALEDSDEENENDPNVVGGRPHKQSAIQLAQERFNESKEADLMQHEDNLAVAVENQIEDDNCKAFMQRLGQLLQDKWAMDHDKQQLQAMAAAIKPINVHSIFAALSSSWKSLDDLIKESKALQLQRQQQEERLRSEEGLKRQQSILEHDEDIQELMDFFHKAGLSKITARRVATDAVLKKISTAKKLAKIWNRGQIQLSDFGLDKDDLDEMEAALTRLLQEADVENNSPASRQSKSSKSLFGISETTTPQNMSLHSKPLTLQIGQGQGQGQGRALPRSASNFSLSQVDVETDLDDDTETGSEISSRPGTTTPKASRSTRTLKYKLTPEGYKSFHGGWIEGISEDQHVYYYNTVTGESSWHLPEELGGLPEENSQEIAAELDSLEHYEHPHLQQPTHHFTDTYAAGDAETAEHHQYYSDPTQYYEGQQGDEGYADPAHPQDHQQQQGGGGGYYDEHGGYYDENGYYYNNYQSDGVHGEGEQGEGEYPEGEEGVQEYHYVKPRTLPIPVRWEVANYSKKEGIDLQTDLLNAQDRWQNALVTTQHQITDQKTKYLEKREEMFQKVSVRVESRLLAFVDDIKFMQKTVKKEMGESNSTERDLRRMFEDKNTAVRAEKLSHILEALEKLKVTANSRYESAFGQITKFSTDWELLKAELLQVGHIYDEGVAANLEQCRLACDHQAKLFAYDQLKFSAEVKRVAMKQLRAAVISELMTDTLEAEERRARSREEQRQYLQERERRRQLLRAEYGDWSDTIEAELYSQGYPALAVEKEVVPEEEFVMSFLLTQTEMELSLSGDYESITEATKTMALELQQGIIGFDSNEKKSIAEEGSWFNKHRETIERHEMALNATLTKVRNKVNEGYQLLNSKIEALDFDVETAAEEELFVNSEAD